MFLAGKQILKIPHSNRIDVRFCACHNDVLGKSGKIGNVTLQQMVVMAMAAFLPVTIPFNSRLTHRCPPSNANPAQAGSKCFPGTKVNDHKNRQALVVTLIQVEHFTIIISWLASLSIVGLALDIPSFATIVKHRKRYDSNKSTTTESKPLIFAN